MPQQFSADKFVTKQYFVTSKDGTKVPYFVVMAKDIRLDSSNPTLLYGYGGFEVSRLPAYSATIGKNWLEQGGVYVLANIRGGGEYGPAWHQAALKQHRHKAYEDFEAIAEDLIARKITSSKHLGIQGGSNGGLLMGAAFTRRPELYNAVVCQVPLLDMKRYNKLLAGASWMGEYGNPDIAEEWDYIKTYSPYHNLKQGVKYPKVFFTTSTRDDRVHPAHARKMVAKMEDMGIDVLYFENIEGGHAGAADNTQAAELSSMVYAYLMQQLR
jgi:prolyl oligopeptidase